MPVRSYKLGVEELDARTVPSAVTTVDPPAAEPPALVAAINSHPLHGSGNGSYTQPLLVVDAGISRSLHGTVSLQGLGTFEVTGWVQGTGMIQNGRATGHLVLSNPLGTLTLELHGPVQGGFGAIPSDLVYSISGGSGAFGGVKGYGTVHTSFIPAPVPMAVHDMPMPPIRPTQTGHFSMSFS